MVSQLELHYIVYFFKVVQWILSVNISFTFYLKNWILSDGLKVKTWSFLQMLRAEEQDKTEKLHWVLWLLIKQNCPKKTKGDP